MLKKILYTIWILVFLVFVLYTARNSNPEALLNIIENKTFDLRQNMIVNSGYKRANSDIVIVAIDDASYEYVIEKYGEWPMPRDIYAKITDYIEAQHPKAIAFDLMFVKSLKSSANADNALVNAFKKYDNLYTAMNFDNQDTELREPAILPDKYSVKVRNNSKKIDFSQQTYGNCRTILPEIISSTNNVGIINVSRADDGILRKMPVFLKYQDKYYPQLALKVATGITGENQTEYKIDKNSKLTVGEREIFIDNDGSAILNWYGSAGTYEQIPLHALLKALDNPKPDKTFENKIVYIGSTASSLFDIKTTPTAKIYPGVEIQATYVNNFLDNNFISKVNKNVTLFIGLVLAVITGLLVINLSSTAIISLSFVSMYSVYILFTYFAMKYHNLWFEMVYPVTLGILVFITAFLVKYIIKSRDFDQQYKLATTDGLTELYNHRYFQEQMRMQVEHAKRYGTEFSLIIIDIDFFKRFNDTFGHQAGDAVLKQVSQLLKTSVRATDVVCRYGGEEISIILPNTPKDVALSTAEKICKRVASKQFKLNNHQESNVTISLGVSTFPHDGENAPEIIEAADKKLYLSKNNGRNQVN